MTMTASQLHEAIELGDEFLVGSSGEKLDYCKSLEDELRGEIGGSTVGAMIRLPNGGYKRLSAEQAAKYASLSPAAKRAYQRKVAPSCADTVGARPSGYRYVRTPAGTTLRMSTRLIDQWKRLTPAQQRSLLWRATRNRTTTRARELPCL
jgi:hypothetical protein